MIEGRSSRIGLTGATGTLGRHVAAALARQGHAVDPFAGDVTDAGATRAWAAGCELVIHCAALVPVATVAADTARALAVNAGGTINVARGLADGGGRLALVSTSHVYRPSDLPLLEDDPVGPVSDYGLTKLHGEDWARRILGDPLVMRLFSYFDARQDSLFVVPALAARIDAAGPGARLDLFGSTSVRDIADAAWLAERVVALALSGAGGVVNVCTGQGHSIEKIASRLAMSMGRDDVVFAPAGDAPANTLVGDPSLMARLLPEAPGFDLEAALARFVVQREKVAQ
ncbi:NAD(P)-dependent oxidoreductase [Croceicoccus sp. BE223]|uniref:NAD-dependent epimerase/dehydratase family protein n=1 Tax=Croceicoccus sp. BE223 TaxID=2817716 RepID=UPI0028626F1C|nr:NAD(P)-dependent oxidoreductase [Croceicoccus sp. BE223]MDR7102057.1 nucleoside-diphosphate-sugar epimerase [Croceicoccus sp. BE223]